MPENSNLPSLEELMWQKLKSEIRALKANVTLVNTARERAEVAGGVQNLLLANLPTTNNTGGDLYWVIDGRKIGESAGHGTGVIAYWNPATSHWLRITDDAQAVN